jgi:flavin-dependent dehydrogenase
MMEQEYDVAVVGASIAGCTAATLFARQGASVALIERHSDPNAHKVLCTHFIQPSAVPTIERLGLASLIEDAGGIRNGIEMWTRWGWLRPPEDVPHGYNIRRRTLDPMLRRLAAQTPGVELMPGQSARDLIEEGGRAVGVEVRDRAEQTRNIRSRLVVAADGSNSRIAGMASSPAKVAPNNRFLFFAYYRDLPLATGSRSQVWMLEPDTASAFPNDGGTTLLGCTPSKGRLPEFKEDLEGSFVRFFEDLPLGPRLSHAERVSKIIGTTNLTNVSRPAAQPGLAFVGDAALWSDPLWAVGCGWAFQSAEWLVDETADALTEGGDLDRALRRYGKVHRARLAGHHSSIADFSTGRPFNAVERLMFSAAARDERSLRHFHAFGSRLIGVRRFLAPGAVGRALWVNAGRRRGASYAG